MYTAGGWGGGWRGIQTAMHALVVDFFCSEIFISFLLAGLLHLLRQLHRSHNTLPPPLPLLSDINVSYLHTAGCTVCPVDFSCYRAKEFNWYWSVVYKITAYRAGVNEFYGSGECF